LTHWAQWKPLFVRVIPDDYRRVMQAQKLMRDKGLSPEEAEMAAFQLNAKDGAQVHGK
jgi:glutamate synthase (ferredoxin)